jgi:hypothetical protein
MIRQGVELSMSCVLRGESSCWIITRTEESFNTYSAVAKISKDDRSQKLFINLGTFVSDKNDNLIFKVFSRQQLIDYSSIYRYI